MKTKFQINKGAHFVWTFINNKKTSQLFLFLVLISTSTIIIAQDTSYSRPSFFIGVAAGANANFYNGSTQQLSADFMAPRAFHSGQGIGLYLAPSLEFHRPESRWGFMFQAGYDNRKGKFKEVISPCNCPADLKTNLTYVTFEPSLRFAPFKSDFYLYGGPRIALVFDQSFTFQQGTNPEIPEQLPNDAVKGDFSKMNNEIISMQIGAGYDIYLSSQKHHTQFVLSPFVAYHPYYGQDPRSIETWNVNTVRAGATLKFGAGKKTGATTLDKEEVVPPVAASTVPSKVQFAITSPKNSPVTRTVNETFPLSNYVFFDLGSTEIPARYVTLQKNQVASFKENNLELYTPQNLSGRSSRQMLVYYNILNILGDRMQKNPNATISLVGSSENGSEDARNMSQSIKNYLMNVFEIEPSRIKVEGRSKPKIPSETKNSSSEFALLREGDRRVSIETNDPALLVEFQSGVKGNAIASTPIEAPIESYLTFDASGAKEEFTSWSIEVKDEKGALQFFGPYTENKVSLPTKSILGSKPEGNYTITMIGKTKTGELVKKEAPAHIVLWTPPINEEVMRFSVIYEFNESKAIKQYEQYLIENVMPKIPVGVSVQINGHADAIGNAAHNKALSLARSNDVKRILEKGLKSAGRSDVTFVVIGNGEDETVAPFANKYPEERFYNRTVIIDVVPKK